MLGSSVGDGNTGALVVNGVVTVVVVVLVVVVVVDVSLAFEGEDVTGARVVGYGDTGFLLGEVVGGFDWGGFLVGRLVG